MSSSTHVEYHARDHAPPPTATRRADENPNAEVMTVVECRPGSTWYAAVTCPMVLVATVVISLGGYVVSIIWFVLSLPVPSAPRADSQPRPPRTASRPTTRTRTLGVPTLEDSAPFATQPAIASLARSVLPSATTFAGSPSNSSLASVTAVRRSRIQRLLEKTGYVLHQLDGVTESDEEGAGSGSLSLSTDIGGGSGHSEHFTQDDGYDTVYTDDEDGHDARVPALTPSRERDSDSDASEVATIAETSLDLLAGPGSKSSTSSSGTVSASANAFWKTFGGLRRSSSDSTPSRDSSTAPCDVRSSSVRPDKKSAATRSLCPSQSLKRNRRENKQRRRSMSCTSASDLPAGLVPPTGRPDLSRSSSARSSKSASREATPPHSASSSLFKKSFRSLSPLSRSPAHSPPPSPTLVAQLNPKGPGLDSTGRSNLTLDHVLLPA